MKRAALMLAVLARLLGSSYRPNRAFLILFAVATIALIWSGSIAQADPFALTGTISPGDQLQLKYQNFEVTANSAGQNLYGLIYITSIEDVTKGTTVWAQGFNGQGQIAGYFNNYVSQGAVASGSLFDVRYTGGNVVLDYNPTVVHSLTGSLGTNANPDGNNTFAVGTPFLIGTGLAGVLPSAPNVTLDSTINSLTAPISGTSFGNYTITGGLFASTITKTAGLQSNINSAIITGDPWPIESHDPLSVTVATPPTVTPEPSSIVLIGLGSIGLLGYGWRRRKQAVA
jgi:hypothetical protein